MQYTRVTRKTTLASRWSSWALVAVVGVSGCAIVPAPPPGSAAPAVQPLQQYMQEAGQASGEGSKERARDLYRTAAKTYPTSKEPWLKLAEDYFEAKNYGQAILASQEVLQRDPTDSVATSVLAVSGLRVSAAALSMLSQQQRTLNGGTRTEAEDLAKVLRDLLGEPVLVPRATSTTKPATPTVRRPLAARAAAVPTDAAASAPSAPSAPPTQPTPIAPKPAPPKADAPAANPFDTLKK